MTWQSIVHIDITNIVKAVLTVCPGIEVTATMAITTRVITVQVQPMERIIIRRNITATYLMETPNGATSHTAVPIDTVIEVTWAMAIIRVAIRLTASLPVVLIIIEVRECLVFLAVTDRVEFMENLGTERVIMVHKPQANSMDALGTSLTIGEETNRTVMNHRIAKEI